MKKVLIFSLAYYPLVGGAEVAIKEITDRIKDIDFDMITLDLKGGLPRLEKVGNVNVYRICGGKLFFPIFAFLKARQLHKKNKYDAIWAMMAAYAGFAALFFKLINPKVPFLLTLQEGDPIDYIKKKVRFVYPLFVKIFTKADMIQTISTYLADWAREMGAKCSIEVVPNGVDISKFEARSTKSETKNKNEKILITTSRLVKKNGISDVIEAMQYLPENVKFWIIGDGPEKENYSLLVTRYGLQNRVKFFGYLSHEEIIKYLHNADIFIRPSLSEGMGNSFIEAMAAGMPVIATPVGGIPDFLTPPDLPLSGEVSDSLLDKGGQGRVLPTGLFCEVRSPKSIAEKVKFILDPKNEELKNRIIASAKKMVAEKYDWNLITEKMKIIFDKIRS